ncbi:hypothetical protein ABKN59_001107 [Abortiporus biennis]
MQSDTETESECAGSSSQKSSYSPPSSQCHPAAAGCKFSIDEHVNNIRDAIETLMAIDIERVDKEYSLHTPIQSSSEHIISFFNCAIHSRLALTSHSIFFTVVQTTFMDKLFRYRAIFHRIASRDNYTHGGSATIICWVDVILVKLAHITTSIFSPATDNSRSQINNPLDEHRDELRLHAMAQLPHKWPDIPTVVSSDYASPAAIRLSVRLLYAVLILGSQTGNDSSRRDSVIYLANIAKHFKDYIHKINQQIIHDLSRSDMDEKYCTDEERTTYAMVVSIFVFIDGVHNYSENEHQIFRPHTLTALLTLIRLIISASSYDSGRLLDLPDNLNTPQKILLHGYHIVPWLWTNLEDNRMADLEVVDYVTMVWLHHLNTPSQNHHNSATWEILLLQAMERNVAAANVIIERLLSRISLHLSKSSSSIGTRQMTDAGLDVLFKLSWAALQLVKLSINQLDSIQTGHTFKLSYKSLLVIFVILDESPKQQSIKDVILETLASVKDIEDLRSVLVEVLNDSASQYVSISLKEKMRQTIRMNKLTSSSSPGDAHPSDTIRQLLQMLAVIFHSGANHCFPQQSVWNFLDVVIAFVTNDCDAANSRALLPSLLTLATLLEISPDSSPSHSEDIQPRRHEHLWNLVLTAPNRTDVFLAATFATYVSTTYQYQLGISNVLSWDYLRDVLLLLLHHQYSDEINEPSAILFSPGICQALSALLQGAERSTLGFTLSSPWTTTLVDALRHITEGKHEHDSYKKFLQERLTIGGSGIQLLKTLEQYPLCLNEQGDSEKISQFVFCRCGPDLLLMSR